MTAVECRIRGTGFRKRNGLGFDAGSLDNFEILRDFARHERVHLERRHRERLDTEFHQAFLHRRLRQKLYSSIVKFCDDVTRRLCRHEYAEPEDAFRILQAGLGRGRDVRQINQAFCRRDHKCANSALFDQRQRGCERTEIEVDPAAENIGDDLRSSAIRHMSGFNPRRETEFLGADMGRATDAHRTKRNRAGLRPGVGNEILHGLPGTRHRHDHHIGADADHQGRCEIFGDIERQPGIDRGRNRQRRRLRENVVTVRTGLRDGGGADRAAGTGTIFDHDGLAEFGREPIEYDARHDIGGTSGPKGDDCLDQMRRPGFGLHGGTEQHSACNHRPTHHTTHSSLRFFAVSANRCTVLRFGASGPATLPDRRLVRICGSEIDDAIATMAVQDANGIGGELDKQLAAIEFFLHAAVSAKQSQKGGVRHDKRLIFAKHDTIAAAPLDAGDEAVTLVPVGDVATCDFFEQVGRAKRPRTAIFDAVEVERKLVAAGSENHGHMARVLRPDRMIGLGRRIEVVVRTDIGKRHDRPVPRLGHQPDVKVTIAKFAFAVRGQRHLPTGCEAVADHGVFILGVFVIAGGARGRHRESDQDGCGQRNDDARNHAYWSANPGLRFEAQSTSVNCKSIVRWSIEKLSSDTMVRMVSPCSVIWASMPSILSTSLPRSAWKITGPSITAPGAIDLSGMRRMRMPIPDTQENFRSRIRRSPVVSSTASLISNSSVRRTLNCPGVGPPTRNAMRLPPVSRPRSDIAISVPAIGSPFGTNTSASSPLLKGSLAAAFGSGTTSPRARVKPLLKSKRSTLLTRSRPIYTSEPSSAIDSESNQPCAVMGLPSEPSIGADSTSASPVIARPSYTMRPVNQWPWSLNEMKRWPRASSRNPDNPPKRGKDEVSTSPLRYSNAPKRVRSWSWRSNQRMGRALTSIETGASASTVELAEAGDATNCALAIPGTAIADRPAAILRKRRRERPKSGIDVTESGMQAAPGCARNRRGAMRLAEEFGKLLGDRATKLLGIHDGDRTAIVARDIMADADCDQFDRRTGLDLLDDMPQVPLEVIARIDRQRGVIDRRAVGNHHQDLALFGAAEQALVRPVE